MATQISGNMVGINYRQARLVRGNVSIETDLQSRAYPLVIKIEKAGICRADVKEVQGTRTIMEDRGPLFGHEFIGRIVHSQVRGLDKGTTVTFNPNVTNDRTTGFAEYFFIDGRDDQIRNAVIPFPQDLLAQTWLPEPFACIIHSMEKFLQHARLKDLKGLKIGILGAGCSGLEFGFMADYLGGDVTVFNRGQARIDFARANGFFPDENILGLDEYLKFAGCFDVVMVSPTKIDHNILNKAAELVRTDGFVHLYGGTVNGFSSFDGQIDIDRIRRSEGFARAASKGKSFNVCGAYGCNYEDFQKAFEYYRRYRAVFPIDKLISTRITFKEFPGIIMKMADETAPIDFPGKVMVEFND